jgi:curved DNA-binding protein CbpA
LGESLVSRSLLQEILSCVVIVLKQKAANSPDFCVVFVRWNRAQEDTRSYNKKNGWRSVAPTQQHMAHADPELTDSAVAKAPRLVAGVNIRELPIGPEEAFVLSRVDGLSSVPDIAAATNFGLEDVTRIVARLAALGAVAFDAEQPVALGERPFRPTPARSGAYRIGPILETQEARASLHPAAAEENTAELEEEVDLDLEQKRRLLALYERLPAVNHYELLGVEALADDKAIRAAYYDLVRVFHPDRFFGKNLGSYKSKLGKVFGRLTEAYEALHRSESRAEYDRYLAARRRTLDFERKFFDAGKQAAEVATALQRIEQAARLDSLSPPPSSGASSSVAPSSSVPPPSGTSARYSSVPPSDVAARRRALARKLGHSSAPPPKVSLTPPPVVVAHAADELKRRYEHRLARARQQQQHHYLVLSEEAAARNDLAAAANALRIACTLAPEDMQLAERLGDLERRASAELWEAYVERGKYAAFEGRHAEAAESYERAAIGRPSPSHFERAAFHTLEAGGDLKRASQLAKQAVALAPQSAKCRLTLAQVYFAAKLRESALAELERARALEPDQPQIKEWIQRAKRGDV